jgi:hypothetical protein
MTLSKFTFIVVVLLVTLIENSSQQYWKNEKIVKPWQTIAAAANAHEIEMPVSNSNGLGILLGSYGSGSGSGSSSYDSHKSEKNDLTGGVASAASTYEHVPSAYNTYEYKSPSYSEYNKPQQSVYSVQQEYKPQQEYKQQSEYKQEYKQESKLENKNYPSYESSYQPSYSEPYGPQVAAPPAPLPYGAYPIQQPTITNTGETIIENLVGGIPFDCHGKPTGHYRDYKYCDIFHACVYGSQRKTYSCPYVGERTFFDEYTKRCEFVYKNPSGCGMNNYYH